MQRRHPGGSSLRTRPGSTPADAAGKRAGAAGWFGSRRCESEPQRSTFPKRCPLLSETGAERAQVEVKSAIESLLVWIIFLPGLKVAFTSTVSEETERKRRK